MGACFSSPVIVDLPRANPPIGIDLARTAHPMFTLVLEKGGSLSQDRYVVRDQLGLPLLKCEENSWFSSKKTFRDAHGRFLFTLKDEGLFSYRYVGTDRNGAILFHTKSAMSFGNKTKINFVNASTGQPMTLRLDSAHHSTYIVDRKDRPIAQMECEPRWFEASRYYINVAAGVDYALIAAVCICVVEAEARRSSSRMGGSSMSGSGGGMSGGGMSGGGMSM